MSRKSPQGGSQIHGHHHKPRACSLFLCTYFMFFLATLIACCILFLRVAAGSSALLRNSAPGASLRSLQCLRKHVWWTNGAIGSERFAWVPKRQSTSKKKFNVNELVITRARLPKSVPCVKTAKHGMFESGRRWHERSQILNRCRMASSPRVAQLSRAL